MHAYRTHTCGELRKSHVGETVKLSGWLHRRREHANALFIDLRDHYGVTQVVVYPNAEFFELASTACFGGFWSRPGLDLRSRSLVTVAQLAALGRTSELKIHLQGALNLGIGRDELIEVLMQTSQYAGIPAAVAALNAAAEVLPEAD